MSFTAFRARFFSLMAGLLALAPAAHAATYQTLYPLNGNTEGSQPDGDLVMDKAGQFYGTTITGGPNGGGTVFRFNPATNTLTVLYAFSIGGATGNIPAAGRPGVRQEGPALRHHAAGRRGGQLRLLLRHRLPVESGDRRAECAAFLCRTP